MLLFWLFFGTFAGVFFSGVCCCFGGFVEHLPENSRSLLSFWPFFGTFAGESPGFATVSVQYAICASNEKALLYVTRAETVLRQ